ncbi:MAG: PQQ-binding-like beta-propeller repeat protein [Lentisphaerae bacterium]|jgi:outer membrane protein assembly factor BamB|nr:PQQ-binding-like beta-propeller repeat protein [Lentisphaerota bacterium]MBT7059159.1 PQQ-binding-like beta-propeller repeat protein [Lentisphaerota bacterium]MBT7842923.1 PQQ-binding-like beta-propeller repeat protein [Lentisphaerota bacterium]
MKPTTQSHRFAPSLRPLRQGAAVGYAAVVLALVSTAGTATASDWPQFRGPGGRGVSDETGLPTQWSETQNLKWRLRLPGQGSSSPIVHGDQLLVTCYSGYGAGSNSTDANALKRHLLSIVPETGAVRWSREIPATIPEDPWRGWIREHGYASHTPVCDGKHVFVFCGKTGVIAFDTEGQEIWRTNVGTSSGNRQWGSAASPILSGNLLFINASEESRAIYALDKRTGKEVWKCESYKTELTYNTPALAELPNSRRELVISVPNEVWGLNPETGECTWWAKTELRGNVSPSLLAINDVVYVLGGYPRVASVAIRAGGEGDVTDSHVLWTSRNSSYIPSAVEHEGHLYWVDNKGAAYCLKADSGELVYREELDLGGRNPVYASASYADGKLYIPSRRQGTLVLAAKPDFQLLARNSFEADQSDFNGSAAISGGKLFLRSNKFLYCITNN